MIIVTAQLRYGSIWNLRLANPGYDRRFGLTYVDYATQQRIPKASYHWYARCVDENRVV